MKHTRENNHDQDKQKAWGWGFTIGVLAGALIVAVFVNGQTALGATRPAVADRPAPHALVLPPNYRTWLRIGVCEQPKRGTDLANIKTDADRFKAIAWKQNYNYTYPGGQGFTRLNWTTFRLPRDRHIPLMSQASPASQMWASERLWRWANRTYPGNGWTAWDCSSKIGWTTTNPKDALR